MSSVYFWAAVPIILIIANGFDVFISRLLCKSYSDIFCIESLYVIIATFVLIILLDVQDQHQKFLSLSNEDDDGYASGGFELSSPLERAQKRIIKNKKYIDSLISH